jgi:hypothetical protein
VLALTTAVIAGLIANDQRAVHSGYLSAGRVAPVRLLQAGLIGLFAYSYVNASRTTRSQTDEPPRRQAADRQD